MSESTFPEEPEAEYKRALWLVRRTLPPSYDHEDIAVEILLESWGNRVWKPSQAFIRQRCIDKIRARQREQRYCEEKQRSPPVYSSSSVEVRSQIGLLVRDLSPLEKRVIWYRYYHGASVRETAEQLGLPVNKTREILRVILFRMRELGDRHG